MWQQLSTWSRCLVLACLSLYRKVISPWTPPCCRFQPTCSAYAAGAVRRHGVAYGLLLAGWRLLRCQPLYRGPLYDPVPPPRNTAGPGPGKSE